MLAVMQLVDQAKLTSGEYVSSIGSGALVLVGVHRTDTVEDVNLLANKLVKTRIFKDDDGKINCNILQTGGQILLVSNFTLQADLSHGLRPNFSFSAGREQAQTLYDMLADQLELLGVKVVKKGAFGEHMDIECSLNGPITLVMDSKTMQ